MFRKGAFIIFFIGLQSVATSQNQLPVNQSQIHKLDSLKIILAHAQDDSMRINIMHQIGYDYETQNVDSALKYYNTALGLARERSYPGDEAGLLASLGGVFLQQGKLPESLQLLFESLKFAEESKSPYHIARAYRRLGVLYYELENYPKAITSLLKALHIDEEIDNRVSSSIDHVLVSRAYEKINKLDSASFHVNTAFKEKYLPDDVKQDIYEIDGNIKGKEGNDQQALISYKEGLKIDRKLNDLVSSSKINAGISELYLKRKQKDSALLYALQGLKDARAVSYKKGILRTSSLLAELYDSIQPSLAITYYKISALAKDSLFGVANIQTIQNLVAGEEAKQKELEDAQLSYRNKLKLYGLLTGLAVLLIITFIFYRNSRQKQKANILLQQQKEKVESTLNELKSTQAQLVQSEKMASLGELTAGIAHEIQNPLNFVNNFSELNNELADELENELKKGNREDSILIARDIKENSQKINHHGKRADAIVKGMLQHSRVNSSQKEPTNINALADEYLRLSYQGLRAKDKSFNATLQTDFDQNIRKINIIPEDVGRVLLNLYNNAFYAVSEKNTLQLNGYQPTVSVSTKQSDESIEIRVKDNGNGIPQKIVDKIFQPFFTTKPTGKGTGLGLSLSYDIIKAHGGMIRVETEENQGTAFIIQLPAAD